MKKISISLLIFFSVAALCILSGIWNSADAAQVKFTSVSQRSIKLVPGGESVTVTMTGANLNLIETVKIFRNRREYPEVEARLGAASATSRTLTLKASSSAKPFCCLSLQFIAGKQVLNVTERHVRLEIVEAQESIPTPPVVKPVGELKVSSLDKREIDLTPGGQPADVMLRGSNLDRITAVQVLFNRRVTQEVEARLLSGGSGYRGVKLRATSTAKSDCCYALRLIANKEMIDVPESLFRIQVLTLSPVQDPIQDDLQTVEMDTELWMGPEISYCPEQGDVGSVIEIRGKSLGAPSMPEKTKVVLSYDYRVDNNPVEGELVSVSYNSLRVRVPSGVKKRNPYVITPGGQARAPNTFNPLYKRHWSPNIFTPQGTLGSLTHIYECRFVFAHGNKNSAFFPSNELLTLGMSPFYFTYTPYEQRIDLGVASTILRVRVAGTNRLKPSEVLETTSFRMMVNGMSLNINLGFESSGTEFVGEYETQDILTGRIHWKHFMNINIDNLVVDATLQLQNYYPPGLIIASPSVAATFSASFSIFDTPSFNVDRTPIKDFLESEVENNIKTFLNSEGFRVLFGSILSDYVKQTYQRTPVVTFKGVRASDGGITFIGYTTYDN